MQQQVQQMGRFISEKLDILQQFEKNLKPGLYKCLQTWQPNATCNLGLDSVLAKKKKKNTLEKTGKSGVLQSMGSLSLKLLSNKKF